MARQFSTKKRGTERIPPNPVIVLIVEGRNVTETLYFRQFNKPNMGYSIRVLASGSSTDPEGMLANLDRFWMTNELDPDRGDRGFIILDLDCDDRKGRLIKKLEKESEIAHFVVSNPCFEVWFLLHFRYTTHAFAGSAEIIRELRRHISDYEKNHDVSGILAGRTETAYENAKKQIHYFEENGALWPTNECNPRTDIPDIMEVIRMLETQRESTKHNREGGDVR